MLRFYSLNTIFSFIIRKLVMDFLHILTEIWARTREDNLNVMTASMARSCSVTV